MLSMPDSVDVAALPDGYGQYLGYVDGRWPTVPELRRRFPAARVIGLTVTGEVFAKADGCDIETGDLTEDQGARWAEVKLISQPLSRPVLYASVGRMGAVLDRLTVHQVAWRRVRLLSAHYRFGEHVCGPATCGEIGIPMDGTQWTDQFRTLSGVVDMSVLSDGFFGQTWTEEIMQQLPVVRQGDSGDAVRTVQGLCVSRGRPLIVDGMFGQQTKNAVIHLQYIRDIAQDGVVGPLTWPVLLGIA